MNNFNTYGQLMYLFLRSSLGIRYRQNRVALPLLASTLLVSLNLGNIPQAAAKEKALFFNSPNNSVVHLKCRRKLGLIGQPAFLYIFASPL